LGYEAGASPARPLHRLLIPARLLRNASTLESLDRADVAAR
jgi:hypothetical protein